MNPEYLSGALTGATIPQVLILQPPQAWAVILAVLAVCCGILWFLTRSVANTSPDDRTNDAARSRRRHTPRTSQAHRPALQVLAHHGSRAA